MTEAELMRVSNRITKQLAPSFGLSRDATLGELIGAIERGKELTSQTDGQRYAALTYAQRAQLQRDEPTKWQRMRDAAMDEGLI